MSFWNWLKSIFTKTPAAQPSPQAPNPAPPPKTPPQKELPPAANIWRSPRNTAARVNEYRVLFNSCVVDPSHKREIDQMVGKIIAGMPRYRDLSLKTNVPPEVIGVTHMKEASFNWNTHLHNGDSLKARTHQVPAGRPTAGNPPFSWEFSAEDALIYEARQQGIDLQTYVWDIPNTLYWLERYNGEGYRNHGVHSPYLWCFSQHYTRGHYEGDGNWQPNAIAKNPGAAVVLKGMNFGLKSDGSV